MESDGKRMVQSDFTINSKGLNHVFLRTNRENAGFSLQITSLKKKIKGKLKEKGNG